MFLYGFIFGSIIVYLICAEEAVLPGTTTHVLTPGVRTMYLLPVQIFLYIFHIFGGFLLPVDEDLF
jgi:hypothetical protein